MKEWPSVHQEESSNQNSTILTPWSWTSGLQDCEKINSCCFSHPLWYFCCGSRSRLIHHLTLSAYFQFLCAFVSALLKNYHPKIITQIKVLLHLKPLMIELNVCLSVWHSKTPHSAFYLLFHLLCPKKTGPLKLSEIGPCFPASVLLEHFPSHLCLLKSFLLFKVHFLMLLLPWSFNLPNCMLFLFIFGGGMNPLGILFSIHVAFK